MRGALLLLLLGGLLAGPASARRPLPVMVLPFAAEGPGRDLSDALELELELSESLLLSSPRALAGELDEGALEPRALRTRGMERLADALALLEQQALVYGVVDGDEVALALFRTNDAAVVWAERVPVEGALEDVRALAARVVTALDELHERQRLPDDELVSLGLREPPPPAASPTAPAPDVAQPSSPATPPDAAVSQRLPAGLDRFGRVTLSYAPSFRYYRACQPADPRAYVPFVCPEKAGVPSTEVVVSPLEAPLGGALHAELYPLSYLGLELSATLGTATLRATVGDGQDVRSLTPDTFASVGGELTSAVVARLPFGSPALGGAASLRGGYHLAWAVTDEVTLDTGARRILFPLLPSYFSHHALLGGGVEVGLGALVRLALDADALFGPHLEGPVLVGKDAFAAGARARLALDVELAAGLVVSAALEGSAVSAGSQGTAEGVYRYTLALEPFDSGQVVVAHARFGIGIGYRY